MTLIIPCLIDFGNNKKEEYIYNGSGQKLYRAISTDTVTTAFTEYIGMFVHEYTGANSKNLKYIPTPEGRIINTGTDTSPVWSWEYNLTDHLGNVRVVLTPAATAGNSTVLQKTHYYPFGMRMSEISTSLSDTSNHYLYNGKEFQTDFGLNWYDYGAKFYDPALGRWHSVDPMAEDYYDLSPYGYCAGNPVLFIDPNGQEIWIYYNDADGNQQKLQYTQGMKYEGDNAFVSSSITSLNQMNSTKIGGQVLGELVGSENQFNFTNTFARDENGNEVKNALSFAKSENGGGEIHAGALMENIKDGQKLESTAHELFHGYQYDKGQTIDGSMRTVNNEVGAYIFGRSVALSAGYGMLGWGNATTAGATYDQAMNSLIFAPSFSYSQYNTAITNFKAGSSVNVSKSGVPGQGIYRNFKINTGLQNPLIKNFFPLVR